MRNEERGKVDRKIIKRDFVEKCDRDLSYVT
jgi:hypothetical protein